VVATRMPMIQDLVRQMAGQRPAQGVNPDEVVAVGAAIQAGYWRRSEGRAAPGRDTLSLGVETLGA